MENTNYIFFPNQYEIKSILFVRSKNTSTNALALFSSILYLKLDVINLLM